MWKTNQILKRLKRYSGFNRIVKRNSEDEDEKVKSYEILNEEQSKTGKWVRITYKLTNVDGTENTSDFYLTKDDTGEWKIQMFGTDRLMDE